MAAYSVTISAVDAASGVLENVNKRFEAINKRIVASQAPMKRLGENYDKFTKVSGLDKIATGFGDVAKAGTQVFQSLMRVVQPLAAIVGVGSIAGVYRLVAAWGDFAATLNISANRAGLSADQLYILQNAAKLANVSASDLTSGMTALSDNMRNAAFGGGGDFIRTLQTLKGKFGDLPVSFPEMQLQTRTQQLETLAQALSRITDPTDKALYAKNLGLGEGMLPMLAGLDALIKKARELGGAFSPEDMKNMLDFKTAQNELKLSLDALGLSISAILGPGATELLRWITDISVQTRHWLDANKDWLQSEINEKVKAFIAYDWKGLATNIENFAIRVDGIVKSLGGWKLAGEIVLAFFVGSWIAAMLVPFLQIGALLLALPGAASVAAGAAILALAAIGADQVVKAIDPKDAMGAWIDRHIPGASYIDNQASRLGFGRDYAEQKRVDAALGYGPRADPSMIRSAPVSPGEQLDNARQIAATVKAAGYPADAAAAFIGNATQENSLSTHGKPGAAGMYQWDPERQALIEQHFQNKVESMNAGQQTAAAIWEIQTNPRFASLNATLHDKDESLAFKTDQFSDRFEAPRADVAYKDKRVAYAKGGLDMINAGDGYADLLAKRQGALFGDSSAGAISRSLAQRLGPVLGTASGDPAVMPGGALGGKGGAGADGKINMNVKFEGAPVKVVSQTQGPVDLRVMNSGLMAQ